MKKLTLKEKVKLYEKEGYNVEYNSLEREYQVMLDLKRVVKDINLIQKYYLHKDLLCKECKKKMKNPKKVEG